MQLPAPLGGVYFACEQHSSPITLIAPWSAQPTRSSLAHPFTHPPLLLQVCMLLVPLPPPPCLPPSCSASGLTPSHPYPCARRCACCLCPSTTPSGQAATRTPTYTRWATNSPLTKTRARRVACSSQGCVFLCCVRGPSWGGGVLWGARLHTRPHISMRTSTYAWHARKACTCDMHDMPAVLCCARSAGVQGVHR